MRTEEELGRKIGARLRADVGDLEVRPDAMLAGIRRRRRTAAVRGGLAAASAAVVVAGIGTTLATASGGSQASGARHPQAAPASAARQMIHVQLDGYLVSLPAGVHVRRAGRGYLVQTPAGQFAIFAVSGPNVGPRPGQPQAQQISAGGQTGWWLGRSQGGELWLRQPGWPAHVFLVAKVLGMTESQALSFAATLNVTTMPVVTAPPAGSTGRRGWTASPYRPQAG
jgi:hypothetical protein